LCRGGEAGGGGRHFSVDLFGELVTLFNVVAARPGLELLTGRKAEDHGAEPLNGSPRTELWGTKLAQAITSTSRTPMCGRRSRVA
jgi:hypothetical protein